MNETPTAAPATDDESTAALREAEERGYLRGLNEAAESRMAEPAMFEHIAPPGATVTAPDETPLNDAFLLTIHPSIWDQSF